MMNRTTDRILVNSVPKSGTYLLSKTVNLLGYRNFTLRENLLQKVIWGLGLGHPKALGYETISVNWGRRLYEWIGIGRHSVTVLIGADSPLQIPAKLAARWLQTTPPRSFIVGHVPWSPTMDRLLQQHGYKHIVITRDPRDVVISLMHYVSRPSHNLYADFMRLAEDERVPFVITGGYAPISGRHVAGVEALFRSVMDWKQSKNCLMVQFENLIGEKGGGVKEAQYRTVKEICDYLDIGLDKEAITHICDQVFDPASPTFRKGQIGGWRRELTPEQLNAFNESCGRLLNELQHDADVDK